jgi:hypothetical protein
MCRIQGNPGSITLARACRWASRPPAYTISRLLIPADNVSRGYRRAKLAQGAKFNIWVSEFRGTTRFTGRSFVLVKNGRVNN